MIKKTILLLVVLTLTMTIKMNAHKRLEVSSLAPAPGKILIKFSPKNFITAHKTKIIRSQ